MRSLSKTVVALLVLAVDACGAPLSDPPPQPVASEALINSLIYATREMCVPYVVDGVSVASLTRRPGVSSRQYNVHGRDVTRYRLNDQPGFPQVTFNDGDYCAVFLEVAQSADRSEIIAGFRRDLRLDGRVTRASHRVDLPGVIWPESESYISEVCVYGTSDALITSHESPPEYPMYVFVQSDSGILAANGCVATE